MNEQHDFWGDTPDWSAAAQRPNRRDTQRDAQRSGGRTSSRDDSMASSPTTLGNKMKGLWSNAMSAGVDATREHRVLDASQPRPVEPHDEWVHDDRGHDAQDQIHDATDSSVSLDDHFVPVGGTARRSGSIDPLLAKLGATAVVLTLLVPLVVGFGSDNGSGDLLAGAELAAQEAAAETSIPAPDPALQPAPDSAAPAPSAEPTVTYLVAADLPPAVPVDADSSGGDAATTTSTGDGSSSDDGAVASAELGSAASTQRRESSGSSSVDEIASSAGAGSDAERVGRICAIDYTVVAGDFWIRLADASGVELAELLEANGATVNTPLYPGSDICLPAGASTPAPPAATPNATPDASTTTDAPSTTPATTPATTAPAASTTTTTAPPTTQAPTTSVAPTPPPGPADIQQIIRDVWPDDLEDRALEIAYRESRFVPTAKNFCCYGLFQIYWTVHRGWLDDIGITDDQQLYDPETNARAALALYERAGGWGPWGF